VTRSSAQSLPPATLDGGLDLDGLPNLLGFRLRMAHVAMYRDFATALAELDLTQKQCATLQIVGANPGVSQVDIAAFLGTDRATMMATVDRLEQRGLLARSRSAADRRRQELHLTAEGQTTLVKAKRAIDAHERRFKARLTDAELDTLFAVLAKLQQPG
jgi:DNA-binding MarR family transcriptional regulator